MKFWILVLLVIGILFYLFFPPVNTQRVCYQTNDSSLDAINSDIFARGISLSMQCERSADALYTLESCLRNATKSGTLAAQANDMITRIVAVVRYSRPNLWTLKATHNEKCVDFSDSQLP